MRTYKIMYLCLEKYSTVCMSNVYTQAQFCVLPQSK
jgi:hypothetical protein